MWVACERNFLRGFIIVINFFASSVDITSTFQETTNIKLVKKKEEVHLRRKHDLLERKEENVQLAASSGIWTHDLLISRCVPYYCADKRCLP